RDWSSDVCSSDLDQIGSIEYGSRRPKYIEPVEEQATADLAARNHRTGIGQARPHHLLAFEAVSADQTYRGMFLDDFNHSFQTFRKDPVVREHNLAVFACGGNLP